MDNSDPPVKPDTGGNWLWILLIVALVSGVLLGARYWTRQQLRAGVLAELKDPDSAQFRNELVIGDQMCGEVNAKNSMGGYVGYRRFVTSTDTTLIESTSEKDGAFFKAYWAVTCEKQ